MKSETIENEILIANDGTATVIGNLAHELYNYSRGEFPRLKCCSNNFYVLEKGNNCVHDCWEVRAAQSTLAEAMNYMDCNRVLVDVSKAPTGKGYGPNLSWMI